MLGGTKQRYIWTVNGTLWSIIDSLAGTKILAEHYGEQFTSTWEIPESLFDAEFIEAKDLRYIDEVVDIQPLAGFSSRLLRSDYAGFSTQVRRSSDNMNADIGFEDSFDFDVPAFNAHVGGGTGSCRTWYDQFNANDALNAVNLQQPLIGTINGSFNRPSYFYEGTQCRLPANSLGANFSGVEVPFTFLTIVKPTDLVSTRTLLAAGRSTSGTPFISHNFDNTPLNRMFRRDDANVTSIENGQAVATNTYFVAGMMFDGVNMYLFLDGLVTKIATTTLTQLTTNRFTIGALGRNTYTSFFKGNIDEALIWDKFIGTANLQQAAYNMSQFYAVY